MIWLEASRYICTWIKKVKTKTLIYNPQYQKQQLEMQLFLKHAENYNQDREIFLNLFTYLTEKQKSHTQLPPVTVLNEGYKSQLPTETILSHESYLTFLNNQICLFSERFFHQDSLHNGSSRHVQIGPVQVKGVGRNMLVSRVDYIHSWGGATQLEGIYSYLISNFLNLQLPRGASPTFRVDGLKKDEAQIFRTVDNLRIAQYSTGLVEREKRRIKTHLEKKFNTKNPELMLRHICFQFAMMSMTNTYNYSMISENLLIDGSIIDCESIYNGQNLSSFNFCIDLCLNGERVQKIKTEKLKDWNNLSDLFQGQQDTMLGNSSIHGIYFILGRLKVVYEDLFKTVLPDPVSTYWSLMDEMMMDSTGMPLHQGIKKSIHQFSRLNCENTNRLHHDFSFNWKQGLTRIMKYLSPERPFSIFFLSQEKNKLYLRIAFHFKRPKMTNNLIEKYNSRNRLNMYFEASLLKKDIQRQGPIAAASNLNYEINRSTFVLPFYLDRLGSLKSNTIGLNDYKKDFLAKNPDAQEHELQLSYQWLENGYLQEHTTSFNNVPKKKTIIAFEVSSAKTTFRYLTHSRMVKT